MIRLALITAVALLASASAFAGDVYDFKIGGQSIHIETPRDCNSPTCATISIPGIYEQNPQRKGARDTGGGQTSIGPDKKDSDTKPAPTDNVSAPTTSSAAPTEPPATVAAGSSPLGVWLTEKNEGKVRIEDCSGKLCGYAVDDKTNANGEKILIDMKPGNASWTGQIHDPKSNSNYDSTIALNGNDRLSVKGCALGGMVCGGQTWTRVN